MTHQSIDAHVAKRRERSDKLAQLIESNSKPAHSRVDFQMNVSDNARV